jgi:hypothetical protein
MVMLEVAKHFGRPRPRAHSTSFALIICFALMGSSAFAAYLSPRAGANPPQDPLFTLMLSQPRVDLETEVPPTATFDPPVVRPGEEALYRVTFQALEQTVDWPEKLSAPKELKLEPGAHGQMLQLAGGAFVPITCFNTRVQASAPGTFSIPAFEVTIYGKKFTVPAATLEVKTDAAESAHSQSLSLELQKTNVYVGQPMTVRVRLAGMPNVGIQVLQQFQITGRGLLVDQGAIRQTFAASILGGHQVSTVTYDATVTAVKSGDLNFFAQGFTIPPMLSALTIPSAPPGTPAAVQFVPGRPILLESPVLHVTARELPREGRLPGFAGAVGTIAFSGASLDTNIVRVGDTLKLTASFRCDNDVLRLVPPALPRLRDWQIFAANTNNPMTQQAQFHRVVSFGFILVPLSQSLEATPSIPFSAFDPEKGAYTDLTIPPISLTVQPGLAGSDAQALVRSDRLITQPEEEPSLTALATAPGIAAPRLQPLQQKRLFLAAQLIPLALFVGLWFWDRRRRYYERYPIELLRLRARRALRHERRALREAARQQNPKAFANCAVSAMRVACAPHYPAEPRALVGSEVLAVINGNGDDTRSKEIVRDVFHAADLAQYNRSDHEAASLLARQTEIEQVLAKLEARL